MRGGGLRLLLMVWRNRVRGVGCVVTGCAVSLLYLVE